MVATLANFNGALNRDISSAVGLSAWASPGFVCVTDATTQTELYWDPFRVEAGASTGAGVIRPIIVPHAYYYLNVACGWNSNIAPTTAPVIRVYGALPRRQTQQQAMPRDISTEWADLEINDTQGHWWVPLVEEGATSVSKTLDTSTAMGIRDEDGGERFYCGLTTPIYLAGTRKVIVTIETAAVSGNIGSSESTAQTTEEVCIWGWFSG